MIPPFLVAARRARNLAGFGIGPDGAGQRCLGAKRKAFKEMEWIPPVTGAEPIDGEAVTLEKVFKYRPHSPPSTYMFIN